MKRCSKCKEWKSESEFNKNKNAKDGFDFWCKQCQKNYYQENRERILLRICKYQMTHKKEIAEYHQENRERELIGMSKYRETHKEQMIETQRKYRKTHKKQIAKNRRRYYLEHKTKENKQSKQWKEKNKHEVRKKDSQQRGLGYNPLNEWFEGSVMHHINNRDVVFIPDNIHRRFNGRGHTLEQHRNKILNYYGSLERMIDNNPIGG